MLKISKAQLEAARAHVATAVDPDSRLRAYAAPHGAGLLYACQRGGCAWGEPAGAAAGGPGLPGTGGELAGAAGCVAAARGAVVWRRMADMAPRLPLIPWPLAAVFKYRRGAGGSLTLLALQRLSPDAPELQQPGPLRQLVAAAEAAWAARGHAGWEVLQLAGQSFEVRAARRGQGPGGAGRRALRTTPRDAASPTLTCTCLRHLTGGGCAGQGAASWR